MVNPVNLKSNDLVALGPIVYLVDIVAAGPNMAITLPAYMAQSSATRA